MMAGWSSGVAAVDAIISRLRSGMQAALGDNLVGLYLYGSLALGDFSPITSDIDFLAAVAEDLLPGQIEALHKMHDQLATERWGAEMEGSYIPLADLRRYTTGKTMHPHIDRGEALAIEQHDTDWIVQRFITREYGVVLLGPDPKTLIDPISQHQLRQAVLDLLWWWEQQLVDTTRVSQSGYQAYAVLSMCRIRYTLAEGAVLSKPRAAQWALHNLHPCWQPLIQRALAWQPGEALDQLAETLAFIRDTLASAKQV